MKRKKMWIYSCIITVAALAFFLITKQGVEKEVTLVTSGLLEQSLEVTGTVKSRHVQTIYIQSQGRVNEVLVAKGDLVKKGDLLLRLDPIDRRIAKLAVEQAKNDYDLAMKDLEKTKKLYDVGAFSRKEYETAEVGYKNAANTYQAAMLKFEKSTESTLLRAPRDGVILDRMVEPNLYASEGTAAFVIGQFLDLEIEAEILADEAVTVRKGNRVIITGKVTGSEDLRGVVTQVAPMAKNVISSLGVNQKRRTVTVAFTQGSGQLRPGVDVDVKIITIVNQDALKIPLSAVFDYKGSANVFVVKDGIVRIQPVVTGIENYEEVMIKSGLKKGELVLTKPDNSVTEGMKIKVVK
ncbi:MAG: efflux RND transporter periplasmic adaptor subunit [Bacillota bacterium]|jgi:HlyD family secretion protein